MSLYIYTVSTCMRSHCFVFCKLDVLIYPNMKSSRQFWKKSVDVDTYFFASSIFSFYKHQVTSLIYQTIF